jgi:hypothetical protein
VHVVEQAIVLAFALRLVLLLHLLLLLALLLVLLGLLQLDLIQLLLQQLLPHLQLLPILYTSLIFLLLLLLAVTHQLVGWRPLLLSLTQPLQTGLAFLHSLEYLFKGIGSLEGFPADFGSRPGYLELEGDTDGEPGGRRRQRLGAGLRRGYLDLVASEVHTREVIAQEVILGKGVGIHRVRRFVGLIPP